MRGAEKYPLSGENSPVKEECVYKCEVTKVVEGEKKYKNIDLWVKIGNDATFPENINMRIEDLLNSYHESK